MPDRTSVYRSPEAAGALWQTKSTGVLSSLVPRDDVWSARDLQLPAARAAALSLRLFPPLLHAGSEPARVMVGGAHYCCTEGSTILNPYEVIRAMYNPDEVAIDFVGVPLGTEAQMADQRLPTCAFYEGEDWAMEWVMKDGDRSVNHCLAGAIFFGPPSADDRHSARKRERELIGWHLSYPALLAGYGQMCLVSTVGSDSANVPAPPGISWHWEEMVAEPDSTELFGTPHYLVTSTYTPPIGISAAPVLPTLEEVAEVIQTLCAEAPYFGKRSPPTEPELRRLFSHLPREALRQVALENAGDPYSGLLHKARRIYTVAALLGLPGYLNDLASLVDSEIERGAIRNNAWASVVGKVIIACQEAVGLAEIEYSFRGDVDAMVAHLMAEDAPIVWCGTPSAYQQLLNIAVSLVLAGHVGSTRRLFNGLRANEASYHMLAAQAVQDLVRRAPASSNLVAVGYLLNNLVAAQEHKASLMEDPAAAIARCPWPSYLQTYLQTASDTERMARCQEVAARACQGDREACRQLAAFADYDPSAQDLMVQVALAHPEFFVGDPTLGRHVIAAYQAPRFHWQQSISDGAPNNADGGMLTANHSAAATTAESRARQAINLLADQGVPDAVALRKRERKKDDALWVEGQTSTTMQTWRDGQPPLGNRKDVQ